MTATRQTPSLELQAAELRSINESVRSVQAACARGETVEVSTTPNGRYILARGLGFSVQPKNDNYWIDVATIDEAMDAFENPAAYRD